MDVLRSRRAPLAADTQVDRYLPTRRHPTVGAWCFLDLYGPDDVEGTDGMQVGPHPHIGLQTVTWLLAGEVVHRDGLGSERTIVPGQLNLMTAGRGIAHAEESPVPHPRWLHGVQLWVALPRETRHAAPAFEHHPHLPVVDLGPEAVATVMVGALDGARSPATVHSPIMAADLACGVTTRHPTTVPLDPAFEHALLVMSGGLAVDGTYLGPGSCVYLAPGRRDLNLTSHAAARALLIGGEPFDETLVMWWNFVGRSSEEVEQAKEDWDRDRRFVPVAGAATPRVPAPDLPPGRLLPRSRSGSSSS